MQFCRFVPFTFVVAHQPFLQLTGRKLEIKMSRGQIKENIQHCPMLTLRDSNFLVGLVGKELIVDGSIALSRHFVC